MITCQQAVRRFWSFLEEELDDETRGRLEEHLAFCRTCCGELEFARELRRMLAEAPAGAVPADVQRRLDAFVAGLGGSS